MRIGRKTLAVVAVGLTGALAAPALVDASITTNTISSSAKLSRNGQKAKGNVLIACTADQIVKITLTFTQGSTEGTGQGAGRCRGNTVTYPVTVASRGDGFVAGNAAACATARNYNRQNQLVDTREWCLGGGVTLAF